MPGKTGTKTADGPTSYALTQWSPDVEAKLTQLVRTAVAQPA